MNSQPRAGVEKTARRRRLNDVLPPLILTPAMIASLIFVYAFIAITVWVSLSKWGTLRIDLNLREPFGYTYQQMFSMPRWHASLLALNNLSGSFSVDWNVVMAGAVVAALPTALVYIFLGRFFVRGLLAGSVKG